MKKVFEMPTGEQLKELAKTRLKEVELLNRHGFYEGAYYLSGYIVEYSLKAKICKLLNLDQYPESGPISKTYKTHKLGDLVILAGIEKELDEEKSNNLEFFTNWSLVTKWSEQFRYEPIGTNNSQAIEEIISALSDPKDGVLTWIKKRW